MNELDRAVEAARRSPEDRGLRRAALQAAARLGRLEAVLGALGLFAPAGSDTLAQVDREPPRDYDLAECVGQLGFGFGDPRPYQLDAPQVAAADRRGDLAAWIDTQGEVRYARGPDWEEQAAGALPVDVAWNSTAEVGVDRFRLTPAGRLLVVVSQTWDPMLDPVTETGWVVLDLLSGETLHTVEPHEDSLFYAGDLELDCLIVHEAAGTLDVRRIREPVWCRPFVAPEGYGVGQAEAAAKSEQFLVRLIGEESRWWIYDVGTDGWAKTGPRRRARRRAPRPRGGYFQFDEKEGELQVRPETHRAPITDLALGPGGRTLRSQSALDGEIRVWDLSTGALVTGRNASARCGPLDGEFFVQPGRGKKRRWKAELLGYRDFQVGAEVEVKVVSPFGLARGAHSSDGQRILLSDESGLVVMARTATGEILWSREKEAGLFYPGLRFLPGDEAVAITHRLVGGGTRLRIHNSMTGRVKSTYELPRAAGAAIRVTPSPAGGWVLVHLGDSVWLQELRRGAAPLPLGAGVLGADFFPDGLQVASVGLDGLLRRTDLEGRVVAEVPAEPGTALRVLPSAQEVVVAEGHFLRRRVAP